MQSQPLVLLISDVQFSALRQLSSCLGSFQTSVHWRGRSPENGFPNLAQLRILLVQKPLKITCYGLFLPVRIILSLLKSHLMTGFFLWLSVCQWKAWKLNWAGKEGKALGFLDTFLQKIIKLLKPTFTIDMEADSKMCYYILCILWYILSAG